MILRAVVSMILAAGLLGFGLIVWVATRIPTPAKPTVQTVSILVAAHELHPGTLLKPDDIVPKKLTTGEIPKGATIATPDQQRQLTGAMVRHALAQGDAILNADVLRPGDHGFLAAVLQPGMRAVTVGVDIVTGTAGLIWPGDRVDVILTQSVPPAQPASPPQVAAETMLADVRVIAIDQRLVEGASPDHPPAGNEARTVTLEVAAKSAERLAVAETLGKLSLAVRSAEQGSQEARASPPPVWAGQVSAVSLREARPVSGGTMHVFLGTADGKEFRF